MSVGVLCLAAIDAAPAWSQERPVTLAEAMAEAASGPDAQAARARAEAARQGRRAAASFLWPTVGAEAGMVRSDDPVAAFGGRLRQGRFTQQDFDPAVLNHPDPLTDWSGGVGAAWAPVDFAADAGYRAAQAEAAAAGAGADWAAKAAAFRAQLRYLEAVGAQHRLGAAEAALEAARANEQVTTRRRDQGLLTDADVLQARAALEGARARSIDAARLVADARGRLAVAMGWPADAVPVPTDTIFAGSPTPVGDVSGRPDLLASEAGVRATEARLAQVRRARLPRVEGFARLETHSASAFSGAGNDWTLGFQVRVPLFTGFALTARERAAASLRDAARSEHDQRVREAEAELEEARRGVESARQGSAAADAAAAAAVEAARLMRRRFEEGLLTTSDLLGAEARSADLTTQAVNARLSLDMALARLKFLTDTTNHDLDEGMDR
jgi:outer membrane protein TolC